LALHYTLTQPAFQQAEVLGTFDGQVADWWEYRGRYVYLPDIINTTVSDREIEARVYGFLHMLQVTPEEFGVMLATPSFLLRVLAGLKYQVNSTYTLAPLHDYSPAAQAQIAHATLQAPLVMAVSLPEKQRLLDEYGHFDPLAQPYRELDLIILSNNDLRRYLHPERGNLNLQWKNDMFEIWRPKETKAEIGAVSARETN
jgi:hypothetical protein